MLGRFAGSSQARSSSSGPPTPLDRLDEPLALLVLVHLGLEADQPLQQPGRRVALLAALAQHLAEAFGARDAVGAGPVHGHVAVALEQAHQPADLVEHLALLGRRPARP